ncbi:MAG: phosphatidylserine decarboxylase [Candidatus Thermoplasmatota archaeon]|nr:phosphatidylserine decarboxylase [Candidatus Thermoplasmatota archaeon]MED5486789.1 phosphatidylserine decarboxylase [Candidatus Thermoplasmatota archaeon]
MGGLARGGLSPTLTWLSMGLAVESIALIVDDLDGLAHVAGMLCFIFTAIVANFYRDPDRPIPKNEGIVVSPADGHIMFVVRERAIGRRPTKDESSIHDDLTGDWHETPCEEPLNFPNEQRWEAVPKGEESETDAWRVAIFMSPFDVHVNRAPVASTIVRMEHRTGKGLRRGPFVPAYRKESAWNERVRTVFQRSDGLRVESTQISGRLARTIAPWSGEGDEMRRGQRYGMIRLGSRVDVRVPAMKFTPNVIGAHAKKPEYPKGEFVQAGTSILFIPA